MSGKCQGNRSIANLTIYEMIVYQSSIFTLKAFPFENGTLKVPKKFRQKLTFLAEKTGFTGFFFLDSIFLAKIALNSRSSKKLREIHVITICVKFGQEEE